MDNSAVIRADVPVSVGFSSLNSLPENSGGEGRADVLRHDGATIFTFGRSQWFVGCPDETCARWLYCRILDNTCRELRVSPEMDDIAIVEALRVSNVPFAPKERIVGYQDPFSASAHPSISLRPPEHPENDSGKLMVFMSGRTKNIALLFGFDSFSELRAEILRYDRLCEPDEDEASFGDGDRNFYCEHRASMDPRLFADTERAMEFASRLASCVAVAAYLRRFSDRTGIILDPSAK